MPQLKKIKLSSQLRLDKLPEDILVLVASYLEQEDVLSLLYTSKAFSEACRLRLYRKILICEKYQDTYFYELSKTYKFTLLSSWPKILCFFSYLHLNRNSCIYNYVEKLLSFNYLDNLYKNDEFKHLNDIDFKNFMKLRQYWEIVVNNFKKLKSFIFPKLPIEKLVLISDELKMALIELSIDLFDEDNQSQAYNFCLPSLQKITLNVSGYPVNNTKSILDPFNNGSNEKLIQLELNGNFGVLDRQFEHFLRHLSIKNFVGLNSSFQEGYRTSKMIFEDLELTQQKILKIKKSNATIHDVETFSYCSDDENFENAPYFEHRSVSDEDFLEPLLQEVRFESTNLFSDVNNELNIVSKFLDGFITTISEIKFSKLQKITLSNCLFEVEAIEELIHFLKLNSQIIELNFNNCYFMDNAGLQVFNNLHDVNNLKNFTFGFLTFDDSLYDFDDLIGRISQYDSSIVSKYDGRILKFLHQEHRTDIENFENEKLIELQEFLLLNKNLENLNIKLSSYSINLDKIFRLIKNENIKTIKYFNKVEIFKIIIKLINLKIFKNFSNFSNLNLIDDYYFGLFKKLIEFFNKVCKNDNYNLNEFKLFNNFEFFDNEIKYLYLDEIKPFFKKFTNLEKFEYFGFTIYRNEIQNY